MRLPRLTFRAGRTTAQDRRQHWHAYTHGASRRDSTLECPSRMDTVSSGTPFVSQPTAAVSRSMWKCPSILMLLRSRRKLRCQSATVVLGSPLPDPKKYRSLSFDTCLSALRTLGGSGSQTGVPVFCVYRKSFPFLIRAVRAWRHRGCAVRNIATQNHGLEPDSVASPVNALDRVTIAASENVLEILWFKWQGR